MADFTMVESSSNDADASATFLEQVFGWTGTPFGPDYTDVSCGAGISLGFQADTAEAPRAPLVVIRVDDLDVSRKHIEEAGGRVIVEPFDFPGGRRLHFIEPGGNELAVWTPTRQQ